MKIAFITVNFHSDEDTIEVVSQLEKNTLPKGTELTIYCVDNSVSKELKENLNSYEHAVYLSSPGNIGFAAGNNLGIKQAIKDQVDVIVLINNDTVVIEELVYINEYFKEILKSEIGRAHV